MSKLLGLTLLIAMTTSAAVRIEKTNYKGWPNSYRVTNGNIELVVTGDIGPRIIRFGFVGGQNLFKEFPEQLGKSGETTFQLRGGHRVWVAPERLATSWALDNVPVTIEIKGDVLEATEPVEPATGIQKQIIVKMQSSGTRVDLVHRIRNTTPWTIELAPWTLTMLAQGGTEITGFPPRGKHPEMLSATNPLVMWAYTDFSDKRWQFTKKYLVLRQDPNVSDPQKVGLFNSKTWAAYLLGTDLFLKQMAADVTRTYPDFGCSFETFTNAEFLEMETLGPLTKIDPGKYAEHSESWTLLKNVHLPALTDAGIDQVLGPVLGR